VGLEQAAWTREMPFSERAFADIDDAHLNSPPMPVLDLPLVTLLSEVLG